MVIFGNALFTPLGQQEKLKICNFIFEVDF